MTLPANVSTVTVTSGPHTDAAGIVRSGTVLAFPSTTITHTTGQVLHPEPVVAQLDATGLATFPPLCATDSPNINVSGFTWTFQCRIDGINVADKTTLLPKSSPTANIDLLVSVAASGGVTVLYPLTTTLDVRTYGAVGNGVADDTAAIQAAITAASAAGGGTVFIPAGTYKLTTSLTLGSNVTLQGAGGMATMLLQTGANVNGITLSCVAGNVFRPVIQSLILYGTGAGTGIGILSAAPGNANALVSMAMRDLIVSNWGSWGISLDSLDFGEIDNVVSTGNGQGTVSGGFKFTGVATGSAGVTMRNCYASSNKGRGYFLSDCNYWSLTGCSSDLNYLGYEITGTGIGGLGISLSGCGCESTVAGGGLDGTGFKISGSTKGVVLTGCLNVVNNAVSFWSTDTSAHTTFVGCVDLAAGGSATASFKSDVSTSAYFISPTYVTATSFAGTYSVVSDALTLMRNVTLVGIRSFGDVNVTSGGLAVIEGSNCRQGAATLVAGTVTVTNTAVTANSRIMLTSQTSGASPGALRISARTAGVSFVITSTSGADTSLVAYEIFEPGG